MKKILISAVLFLRAFCAEAPVDCVAVFEARKDELRLEVDKLDEARQSMEAFRASTNSLYEERNAKLIAKEADINATLAKVQKERRSIDELVKKNDEILAQLKAWGKAERWLLDPPRAGAQALCEALDTKHAPARRR